MNAQEKQQFAALFSPSTIALVGASGDERKHTSRPQRTLRKHGYQGTIIPINPSRDEVGGDRAYPSLLDVPGNEPRQARTRRTVRVHIEPELRGPAGQGRPHAPRVARSRRGYRNCRPFRNAV